jgi:hypothetical protein
MTEVRNNGRKGRIVTPERIPELTIDLDTAPQAGTKGRPDWRRYLRPSTRQTVTTAGLTAIAALLVGYTIGGGRLAPNHPQAAAAPPAAVSDQQGRHARLLAPATAAAGERVPILAFRNTKLCGPTELSFDNAAVGQRIIGYPAPDSHTYPQIFMSMDVPRSAKAGTHEIELLGPVAATQGAICADIPERQGRIATTTISISLR